MLMQLAVFVAVEAAATVASRWVVPTFARRFAQSGWRGRAALSAAAAAGVALGACALATRPALARGFVSSLALSEGTRAVTALRAPTDARS